MVNLRLFIMVITNKALRSGDLVFGGWVCEEGAVLVFCQRRNSKILRRASQVKLVSVPSSLGSVFLLRTFTSMYPLKSPWNNAIIQVAGC